MTLERLWWALVRFGFRLLYNELAFTYDLVSRVVSLGQWRAWQRAAFSYLDAAPGDIVLEIAHGTGDMQLDLRAAGVRTVGLDRSPHMGRIARRKLAGQGFRARLVRADAMALPFGNARFPAVVSTFPTNFIGHPRTLAEIRRVLRPGGRLVIVMNGQLTGAGPVPRLLELAYRVTGQRDPWPVDGILAQFREAGLPAESVSRALPVSAVSLIVAQRAD